MRPGGDLIYAVPTFKSARRFAGGSAGLPAGAGLVLTAYGRGPLTELRC
jgi:hypothetical protein